MVKRGGKVYKVILNGKLQKMNHSQFKLLEQKINYQSLRIRRTFYTLLDIIILISFSLALYFTYFKDYTKTILFLIAGTLLLIFFILKRAFRSKK